MPPVLPPRPVVAQPSGAALPVKTPRAPLLKPTGVSTANTTHVDRNSLVTIEQQTSSDNKPVFRVKSRKGTLLYATKKGIADAQAWIAKAPMDKLVL